jgi:hypothetical protein
VYEARLLVTNACRSNLNPVMNLLKLLPVLLARTDPELAAFIEVRRGKTAPKQPRWTYRSFSMSCLCQLELYRAPRPLSSRWLTFVRCGSTRPQRSGCPPFHAIAGLITWHTHECHDLVTAARLLDLFLASTPLLPLYLTAELLRAHRAKVRTGTRHRFRLTHRRRPLSLYRWCGRHVARLLVL